MAASRRDWTFAGSDAGGRGTATYMPIETAKLDDVDRRAWLVDVLARLPGHHAREIAALPL